ncbi:polar amino acid ABC transporter, inner membrane subunit [Paenibacillus curdlanolyticus YK9]|uniref:Polar amino acid ABC transporter, inner membrane subunit n=1 Tax=Paenibacillus curdlanolyticus YK9 TaxID=717606 RepID=E0I7Y2_9BACL|nr:amino acid ABC transporter permease [Paenibacillus curdlanolyticus]EFM11287.1 polar amino acid ABC transporter, inner membrane subunit [Paenibacillus curdlanolyticus YK9]
MTLDPAFIAEAFWKLLSALPTTLLITVVSVLLGFLIGAVTALLRVYRVPVLHPIASFYVKFIRGTPMLMHLFLIYFGLPKLIDWLSASFGWSFTSVQIPILVFVLIAFSITAGAYMSEIVRSGMLAVDRGQLEAALSVGMTRTQAIRRIVFPQALAVSLPNLSNALIGMLHGSTVAFTVPVIEVFGQANIVAMTNWKYFEAFIAAAIIYWALTLLIEKSTSVLEKRISLYNRGGVA